jgi:hypothetical protein
MASKNVFNERIDAICITCGQTTFQIDCQTQKHESGKATREQLRRWLASMYDGDDGRSHYNGLIGAYRFIDVCCHCDRHESKHINGRCLLFPNRFEGYVPNVHSAT